MKTDGGAEHSVLGDEDPEAGCEMNELADAGDNEREDDQAGLMRARANSLKEEIQQLDDQEWQDSTPRTRERGGSLSPDPEVDIYSWSQCGYLAQYFVVGLIYGGLPATIYGLFLGYLKTPAYVYSTAAILCVFPWSFKFLFGLINDTRPIMGYHRKPYMVIGWSMCSFMMIVLALHTLPPPYWCRDDDGNYLNGRGGRPSVVCNEEASTKGGEYAFLMMMAALGYVVADVAADGLTVQYARREPEEVRGTIQTTVYLTRTIGTIFAQLIVAFGMNGKEYLGEFDHGLSFNQYCGILAVPCIIMVPLSWMGIQEPGSKEPPLFKEYMAQSKAMFYVIVYSFCQPVIGNISTPAGGLVKSEWAEVKNMQNTLFSLCGSILFALGLGMVKKYCLNKSWKFMILTTTIGLNMLDMPFSFFTIFDVVRNQYFYLGETLLYELPAAANFVVATFYIVEMADDGNEGLVYGLLTTISNLGSPFARALGNQLFGRFSGISDSENYADDTPEFRRKVAWTFVLTYFFAFLSCAFIYFLPDQKAEAQHRKLTWSKHTRFAYITASVGVFALLYATTMNFLVMFPSTMCLKIAGGDGCDD